MVEMCPKCGMPKDICVCEMMEKEESRRITIYSTRKKFRKFVTIIEGLDEEVLKKTAKELKNKIACGGTAKDGMVVLQGDHTGKVKKLLVAMGYPEENITVDSRRRR